MEAFIWALDGLKFSESGEHPKMRVGERVRITLVNDTMMEHPMHLHGVFIEPDNGAGLRTSHASTRFAPCIGVEWATASLARSRGEDTRATVVVIGIRAWF